MKGQFRTCYLISAVITVPIVIWIIYGVLVLNSTYYADDVVSTTTIIDDVDYSMLINLTNFRFTIFEDICRDSAPFLLILIVSASGNFERRKLIRETWGRNTRRVRTAFLLASNCWDDIDLEQENAEHGDLLQGNFEEAYKNLTYKHVMALKYVTYHCPKAQYILKTDDDVFVNTRGLLDLLDVQFKNRTGDLMFCKTKKTSKVVRSTSSKWVVSIDEYPNEYFPPYCWGFTVLYTPDVMSKLHRTAQWTQFLWIEDIFVTGILAKANNLTHTDASAYVIKKTELDTIKNGKKVTRKFLFAYNLSEKLMHLLWRNARCGAT